MPEIKAGQFLDVSFDIDEATKYLSNIEKRQIPFATRLALSGTAGYIVKNILPEATRRSFDRPTKFTQRAFYFLKATRSRPFAVVGIKDSAGKGTPAFKYLRPQIEGGARRAKSHEKQLRSLGILGQDEFTVPGDGMRLNQFGNLTANTYSKILADVQARSFDTPAAERYNLRSGQATLTPGKKRFFYHPNLRPRGIYRRTSRKRIIIALLFVKQPTYKKRFDFDRIVGRAARKRFPLEFERALSRALATAR